VVQHRGLGRPCRLAVVVRGDRVQHLREHVAVERAGVRFDQAQPEVHVTEQPSLVGRVKPGPALQLTGPADVVQQRRGQHDVRPEPRVELRRLATECRHPDGVLEQAARVSVVPVGTGSRQPAHAVAQRPVREELRNESGQARMGDLAGEELEEAIELADIATQGRREQCGVLVGCRLERSHLHLEATAEALDPSEHTDGVTFREAPVEKLDVVPHACFDASARIDQLERQIRGSRASAAALLASDGEHPFHRAILRELADRRHSAESRARRRPVRRVGRLDRVPDVSAFRAVRYAAPSSAVVAPPYDVISPSELRRLRELDPHNVVHLTLNDDAEEAGRLYRSWLDDGVLTADDDPAIWAVAQEYVGPDGVGRRREGIVASLAIEPYENGAVLPHERTHASAKEGRLRLLRAAHAQLEPIFLLYDGKPPVAPLGRPPDLAVDGTSLWRLPGAGVGEAFSDHQLLIADGHHRYETALAYALEQGAPASARLMVVLVSTDDPGLEIFATHRVFSGRPDIVAGGERLESLDVARERLEGEPYDRAVAIAYSPAGASLVRGDEGRLDVELVDRYAHAGIAYTPDWDEAVARVDSGAADVAFLLRPTPIGAVFERARQGRVMPPKTTYFFPKLTSGLLFHPL
jgi:uncharacterized protein (DUF1015 family)